MPVPKRKHSKGRRDRRRSQDKILRPSLTKCRYCGADKVSHRICPQCDRY